MRSAHAEVRGSTLVLTAADGAVRAIALDSPDWRAWLADDTTRAFRYVHPHGTLSVRKERRARGMGYWSAYQRVGGTLRKHYLGRSTDLTLERLVTAARDLGSPAGPRAPALAPPAPPVALALIPTKLAPPLTGAHVVVRRRLLDRVSDAGLGRLTLLQAPAGSGKTTLLASLASAEHRAPSDAGPHGDGVGPAPRAQRDRPRLAWLSLDPADNDPIRFWRYVFAALVTALPRLGAALPLLQSAGPDDIGAIAVATLVRQLDGSDVRVTLVFDDYHVVDNPAIHAGLARLLEHPPRGLHLVIASRTEPPLPLARLRVRGLLHEIRASDLAFRAEEAAALLTSALPVPLTPGELDALTARTEGWAAGLRLAALAHADGGRVQPPADGLTVDHQHLFDYLMDEVFHHQPAPVQQFLLATACAERLCAPLCDALLETFRAHRGHPPAPTGEPAGDVLVTIERQGLFLTALDAERRWFRYHHLFAAFLRRLLEHRDPALPPLLHRRAGAWFAEKELVSEAVTALVAGGATDQAADLVEAHAETTLWQWYDQATVRSWLAALPQATVRARWRLAVAEILTLFVGGPAQIAATVAPRIDALLAAVPAGAVRAAWEQGEPPPAPATPADREARAVLAQIAFAQLTFDRLANGGRGYDACLRRTDQWVWPEDGAVYAATIGTVAIFALFHGDLETAERQYTAMHALARGERNHAISFAALIALPTIQYLRGSVGAARLGFATCLRYMRQHRLQHGTLGAIAGYRLGWVAYESGDLAQAQRLLEGSLAAPWQWWEPETNIPAALFLALTYVACGDQARAHAPLDEAEQLTHSGRDRAVLAVIAAARARVCLRLGDRDRALRWLAEREVAAVRAQYAEALPVLREIADLALARVLHAAGRFGESVTVLTELERAAVDQGRNRSLWEIRILLALARDGAGDRRAAVAALAAILPDIGAAQLVRLLVDEGPAAAALVAAVAATPGHGASVRVAAKGLLAVFPEAERPALGEHSELPLRLEDDAVPLVEPVSEREQEVLRLLAAGATTREIARALVVAESTVKWHVRNLCGKLQVRTRLQLVARARALGLLP